MPTISPALAPKLHAGKKQLRYNANQGAQAMSKITKVLANSNTQNKIQTILAERAAAQKKMEDEDEDEDPEVKRRSMVESAARDFFAKNTRRTQRVGEG